MKQFLLFSGLKYYPLGGMEDFVKDFDSLEEASEYGKTIEDKGDHDWWNVYDTDVCGIVWEWEVEFY